MASTIKVKVWRERGGRAPRKHTLSQEFACADSNPSAAVLKDCEREVVRKFKELYGAGSPSSSVEVA